MKTSEEHFVKTAKALAGNTKWKILQEISKHGTTGCGDAVGMSVVPANRFTPHKNLD